jgi:putative ABC transport system substrate-binding protein
MKLKTFGLLLLALSALLLGCVDAAHAQQVKKVWKIGLLMAGSDAPGSSIRNFAREFKKVGYVENENVSYIYLFAEGNLERLPALAQELVRRQVDVIVTRGTPEALALKKATTTIPIVFYSVTDPVGSGLIESLARPGSNITGFSSIESILAGKRLELLKETVPKLSRVAVLWNSNDLSSAQQWKETQRAARGLNLELYSMEVARSERYEIAFSETIKSGSSALTVIAGSLEDANADRIVQFALKNRLATIFPRVAFVVAGGLMSYGADRTEPMRRVALKVDKILKGAKPAELPVEQPTKFELVINLKTAKQIGLAIPKIVLARADRVIK